MLYMISANITNSCIIGSNLAAFASLSAGPLPGILVSRRLQSIKCDGKFCYIRISAPHSFFNIFRRLVQILLRYHHSYLFWTSWWWLSCTLSMTKLNAINCTEKSRPNVTQIYQRIFVTMPYWQGRNDRAKIQKYFFTRHHSSIIQNKIVRDFSSSRVGIILLKEGPNDSIVWRLLKQMTWNQHHRYSVTKPASTTRL